MSSPGTASSHIAIIGGGPAGLMAAEILAQAGMAVSLFERMPSVGRKLLMAGRGGLNITHSEPIEQFRTRYGAATDWMAPHLAAFPPAALIAWCAALGQQTFIGSSGRVFPQAMKASPLLRAWLTRLDGFGVRIATRMDWTGWNAAGALAFADGSSCNADATVLALGGASWPRLGADGGWTALLPDIAMTPLQPANCGFKVDWSDIFRRQHAGAPLKRIALHFAGQTLRGEAVITAEGIEGGAIYALSARLRETIAHDGAALLQIDLRPDLSVEELAERLDEPRRGASLSNFLRKRIGLPPVAIGLVQEALHAGDTAPLAHLVKALPLRLTAPFGLARAISTAGGIALDELDAHLMLRRRPGIFVAGEMLDWEAPTGGYLLQGCLATGAAAGHGVLHWLQSRQGL
ncbi:MAG: TIGR03862 family flavoprotein [Ferrovibrio sp.]|uniref:NAD(P)/FAD-dependent oxidoreductase n=1 Tax=Ferrovibrio sp. TaxID=1917215 RepID=UPI002624DF6B|nr:TIGR03862 family flavoprotein [Ferrovibrio sp.]MCW0233021.1 TIGR03862 family flavoprotein [Ferrovibrio sp.]